MDRPLSELLLTANTLTANDFQVSYVGEVLHVSIPKFKVLWSGTADEASDILRGLITKWGEADVHALLLKGVLKK